MSNIQSDIKYSRLLVT